MFPVALTVHLFLPLFALPWVLAVPGAAIPDRGAPLPLPQWVQAEALRLLNTLRISGTLRLT